MFLYDLIKGASALEKEMMTQRQGSGVRKPQRQAAASAVISQDPLKAHPMILQGVRHMTKRMRNGLDKTLDLSRKS